MLPSSCLITETGFTGRDPGQSLQLHGITLKSQWGQHALRSHRSLLFLEPLCFVGTQEDILGLSIGSSEPPKFLHQESLICPLLRSWRGFYLSPDLQILPGADCSEEPVVEEQATSIVPPLPPPPRLLCATHHPPILAPQLLYTTPTLYSRSRIALCSLMITPF